MARIVQKLIDLLSTQRSELPDDTSPPHPAPASDCTSEIEDEAAGGRAPPDLADFLASASSNDNERVVAGSIRLIELKDVRAVGDKYWTAVAERVRTIAEDEIDQRLGGGDFRQRTADGQFLFCFSDASLSQAKARTRLMSDRIRTRLADEVPDSAGRFEVEPFVASLDRDELLSSDMSPLGALAASLERIRIEQREQMQVSRASLFRSARIYFQPGWSRRRSGHTLNRCVLDNAYQHLLSDRLGNREPIGPILGRMDAVVLTKIVESLHAGAGSTARDAAVLAPLHYWTLKDKAAREEYLSLSARVPDDYARLIYLEVQLPESDEPPLDLKNVLDVAHERLPRLVLQLQGLDLRLIKGMSESLCGVSCSLRCASAAMPAIGRRLAMVAEMAAAANLISCATGADSLGLADSARKARFDFVFGNAIHGTQEEPHSADTFIPLGDAPI